MVGPPRLPGEGGEAAGEGLGAVAGDDDAHDTRRGRGHADDVTVAGGRVGIPRVNGREPTGGGPGGASWGPHQGVT
ncbi:hypothetical protein GCM10023168_35930 [Fodinibacter luteus]|uniref:Uncharacterized protein n=1 Tax=Fodinibacter luteus TaxID=552064 RepID=A0ABP8KQY1_9MICO